MTSQINPSWPVYGTPTTQSVRDNFSHAKTEISDLQDVRTPNYPYLSLSGGSMNGNLLLAHDPNLPLEAVTKEYADNKVVDGGNF
jgi:hypothetical protein